MDSVSPDYLDFDMLVCRGGAVGEEDELFLCACPRCRRIVLVDSTSRTLYLDGDDLGRRLAGARPHACENCGTDFALTVSKDEEAPSERDVGWDELAASPWHWITVKTRDWSRIPFDPPAGI